MRIVFLGSAQFAVLPLEALIANGYEVSCVVTQPDRKKGRGLHLEETCVKKVAGEEKLDIYQPLNINSPDSVKFLKNLNADLFAVISYGQILSEEVIGIPKIFTLNLHASLLPKYRGAAPINWAIINGEKNTGVTIMKVAKQMDAGPVLLQRTLEIKDNDTNLTLQNKLSEAGCGILLEALRLIELGKYKMTEQNPKEATFAPKLKKEDGQINWKLTAKQVFDLVRGCVGWPGAFTHYKGKTLKVCKASACRLVGMPAGRFAGEILETKKNAIVAATGQGNICIEELQLEGKRKMTAEEFIAGHKIKPGEYFK